MIAVWSPAPSAWRPTIARRRFGAPELTTAVVTSGPVIERVAGHRHAAGGHDGGGRIAGSGTISSLHADFNTRVRKGQVLARLEPSLFQTQVEQAGATVQRLQADVERAGVEVDDAHAKLRRAEQLSAQQLIAASDLDTARTTARQAEAALKSAQAQVAQARAAVNQSRVNLGHAIITAPVDGSWSRATSTSARRSRRAMQAPTLFVIAEDLTRMQVNASVDEADIGQIAAGPAGQLPGGRVSATRSSPAPSGRCVSIRSSSRTSSAT